MVIALSIIGDLHRVYFDYGTGSNRHSLWLNEIDMSHAERLSLIGFHSFTGSDFTSSFFKKGKLSCWKAKNKQFKYQEAFQLLGTDWELSDELLDTLQEYVCSLFNSNVKQVNNARTELFHKKFTREKKAIDLSALPPCYSVLKLHCQRANTVAAIRQLSGSAIMNIPNINSNGWYENGDILWVKYIFPEDMSDILLHPHI